MKTILSILVPVLIAVNVFAGPGSSPNDLRVAQLIVNNPNIMAQSAEKIKRILKVPMKFSGIEVNSNQSAYAAILTYTDVNPGTFFNPAFGRCQVIMRGRIVNANTVTVDNIKEYDCGE